VPSYVVQLQGDALDAVDTIDPTTARLIVQGPDDEFVLKITSTSVTYSTQVGEEEEATFFGEVDAELVSPLNTMGAFGAGTLLVWSAGQPTHALETGSYISETVENAEALLRNTRISYEGTRVVAMVPRTLIVVGVRFSATRRVEESDYVSEAVEASSILGDVNVADTDEQPDTTPIDQFSVTLPT
jgi:hypothetical protein